MKNEKIKNYIIIGLSVLLIISSVGIFRSCNIYDDGNTDAGITRSIKSAIRTAIYIAEIHRELVRISDQFRIDIEQLRTENTGLEQIITDLRENNKRLGKYKSTLEQTIRDIVGASNGIANGIDRITEIIQAIQSGTEAKTN